MSKKCKSGKLRQKRRKQAFIAAGKTHTSGLVMPLLKHTGRRTNFGVPPKNLRKNNANLGF